MSDPKRLLDDLGGGELRDLLSAGKSELPDNAQMLALAAKVGVVGALGSAGVGGAGAGAGSAAGAGAGAGAKAGVAVAAAKGGLALKVGVAVAVIGAAGAGTVAVKTQRANVADTRPMGIVASAPTSTALASSEGTVRLPPRVDPFASTEPSAKPVAPTVTKSAAPNPADEVKLLERAQDALKSNPTEALALCNEHARLYPNGMLAQEREVIAVEALVKSGRTAEARARADKFKARYPGSSHARRIDAIVGP
jgi:hypothetical protein